MRRRLVRATGWQAEVVRTTPRAVPQVGGRNSSNRKDASQRNEITVRDVGPGRTRVGDRALDARRGWTRSAGQRWPAPIAAAHRTGGDGRDADDQAGRRVAPADPAEPQRSESKMRKRNPIA